MRRLTLCGQFRSTPRNGHCQTDPVGLFRARSGHTRSLHAYWMSCILLSALFLFMSRRLITAISCGPSPLSAREPPGCPQRLARCVAMWCDAQRRVVERCDAPRRVALPTVMSITPTRLIDATNMAGREATSRQRCCRSRHLFSNRAEKDATAGSPHHYRSFIRWQRCVTSVILFRPKAAGRQLAFVPIGPPTTFGGLTAPLPHFRFTPDDGHRPSPDRCPFRADIVL